ncbi:MAG: YbjN domain-containing protein [Candidatus Dormibacteria bacterium]
MTDPPASAADAIQRLLAAVPELRGRQLSDCDWLMVLPGRVRRDISVHVHLGRDGAWLNSFLLRGPRRAEDAAALHRLLLRRNAAMRRVRMALDADDDVVVVGLVPAPVRAEELDAVLAEILTVTESAFEAFVHLGYPGVFSPLEPPPDG